MKALALTCIALVPLGAASQTPQAPRADAAISGVVVEAVSGRPVADAVVQVGSVTRRDTPENPQRQFTDARGRFVFTDLAPGTDYVVLASKSGFFDGGYGRVACHDRTTARIAVQAGQWFDGAKVELCRPGSISGTVTDERGEPVIGVHVRAILLTRVAGHDRMALGPLLVTDDRGMYRAGLLKPGRHVVAVPSQQASAPADASAATLQGIPEQQLALFRARGRAIPDGDPMIDVDDTTHVRVGRHPIPPPPVGGRRLTYPMMFSSGATPSRSGAIALGPGEERLGVDIRLNPVPAVRISGTLQAPPEANSRTSLRLLAEGVEEVGPGMEAGTALIASDGSFAFATVPAGRYTLEASLAMGQYEFGNTAINMFFGFRAARPLGWSSFGSTGGPVPAAGDGVSYTSYSGGGGFWGRIAVDASGGDVGNIVLPLRPGGTMSGRFVSETDSRFPASTAPWDVDLESATGALTETRPRNTYSPNTTPAGAFRLTDVAQGLYVFRSSPAWMIKSVMIGGRDYANIPLDTSTSQDFTDVVVTVTNAIPSLTGNVRDSNGAPATRAAVIVFPVEREQWTNYGQSPSRIKAVHTSNTGTFTIRAIPAGHYFVVAVPETEFDAWQEPEFFPRAQAVATRVTIAWGDKATADARVAALR